MGTLRKEIKIYLAHCYAVFSPGYTPPLFEQPQPFEGSLSSAEDDHIDLVIEEGRRQLDRQLSDLERIRSRSAVLVTVGIAEIGLFAAGVKQTFEAGAWSFSLWIASGAIVVFGLLGAAAILTASASFGRMETRLVAQLSPPARLLVAEGYAESTSQGECTVATRLTVFRAAAMLLIVAAVVYACSWGVAL